jgi:type II secretory pathway pseudopilin PulG
LQRIGSVLLQFSVLAVAAFLGLSIRVVAKWQKLSRQELIIASSTIVYMFGMAIALVEYRYMIPALTGLLLWSAIAASDLKVKNFKNHSMAVLVIAIILTIITAPLVQTYSRRHEQDELFHQTEVLRNYIEPGEHIASDSFDTIRYCFVLKARCYGRINPTFNSDINREQLAINNITTVIIRHSANNWSKPTYLDGYSEKLRMGEILILKKL